MDVAKAAGCQVAGGCGWLGGWQQQLGRWGPGVWCRMMGCCGGGVHHRRGGATSLLPHLQLGLLFFSRVP
eukprot:scaffold4779_cov116-Isochrysis_galbana.AAC.8